MVPKCLWTCLTICQKPSGLKFLCKSIQQMASREADFQLPWSIDSLAEDAKNSRKKCIVFKQKPILSQAKPNIDPVTGTWPEMSWHSFKPDVTLLVSH